MKKWYVNVGSVKIEKVDIERETDYFVVIEGLRRSKGNMLSCFYANTEDEAKTFLIKTLTEKRNLAEQELGWAEETLHKAKAICGVSDEEVSSNP